LDTHGAKHQKLKRVGAQGPQPYKTKLEAKIKTNENLMRWL
jgi:hypothetical protein